MAKTVFELLRDLKLDRNGINQQLNQVRDDINGFNQRIKDQTAIQLSLNVWKLKQQLDEARAQIKLAKDQGNRDAVISLTADASRLQQSLTQAGRELRNYTRTGSSDISVLWKNFQWINTEVLKQGGIIQSTIQKMKISLGWIKELIVWAFSITAITQFIRSTFDLTSQIQQAKIAFTNLFKSEEVALKLIKDIQSFAKQTPFDQFGLIDGAKRLSAYGFQANQIIPIMNALGNAVAGVWWSQETLNGVIVALGQMQTKGKLVQQEVNQIAERGIPIFEILRQKLWLTQAQLADIGNQNISSAQAIPLILEWINEKFWWLMEQQAKTLQGRLSNLIDTFKIGLASFGEVIAPLFVWIIATLQTLLTPAFNILILWVKGLAVVFRTVFDGMKQIYQFFANNFVIITRVVLASFLSALIIMRQQTIITFLQGVVQNFIKGMTTMITSVVAFWRASLNFILNLRQITIEAVRATVAFVRKSVALAINTARTYAQIIANNLASFSFRALGLSILGTIKNLILLGARFFLIASIVTAVVVAIFTNRNTLKEKLKPVFDFMAKVWQAVPGAIAKARNFAVDVIFWAIKGILKSGKTVADFLKNTFNVDIGTDNINKYIAQIDQARTGLQTNADQVKSIFEWIADESGKAFDFVKTQILGTWWSTDQLWADVLSLAGKFDGMGDASEKAGKKWSKASQQAQEEKKKDIEQLKTIEGETKQLEKANDKLQDAIQKVSDAQQEYKDAVLDSTNQIKNNLKETQREYDKTIKKIQETRDEELKNIQLQKDQDKKNNLWDFVQGQAEDLAKSQQQQKKLETKLSQESDSEKQLEIQQEITAEITKQQQIQQNLNEIKKQQSTTDATTIDQLIKEQQLRANMTEEQRAFYDFKKQQQTIDSKAQEDTQKATQKALDDKKQADQELALTRQSLETQQKIISQLQNVKSITKSQVDSFLSWATFQKFDEDSQKLIEKLLELKLKISDATREKQSAKNEVVSLSTNLETDSSKLQLANIKQVKQEYDELIQKVQDALKKSNELKAQTQSIALPTITKKWSKTNQADPLTQQLSPTLPLSDPTTDQQTIDIKKATVQWFTDFKKAKVDEDLINQQTGSQTELGIQTTTIQQIQSAQAQSVEQMKQIWQIYFSQLVTTTRSTVASLRSEYSSLISQLLQVIALQSRVRSWGARWFASGGYTWGNQRNRVAGVVHQGEYVVPKRMVEKYWPMVSSMENIRLRGFANGWYTSTTNRAVNINGNINVGSAFDLNQQMDYWKWKI